MGMKLGYRIATAAAGAIALTLGCPFLPAAHAADTVIGQDQMNALCAAQYRGANTAYYDGTAYLTAPGDASSWRCKQESRSPGGGALSNLGIDPAAYCSIAPGGGVPNLVNPGSAQGWVCRS